MIDIKTGKINDFIKFDTGNTVMVIGGRNTGRVGMITHRERHASKYSFTLVWGMLNVHYLGIYFNYL